MALTREAGMVAVAPAMPMKLIEPRDGGAATVPTAAGNAWGIEAVGAHTSPFSGKGVVVAVLDTGIDANHPAFPSTGLTLIQQDFTGEGLIDQHGHGTHCAGTVFGRDVQNTRIGVARGVGKALIGKVIGQRGGSSDRIAQAILWAVTSGANVISMSLGIDFPGYVAALQAAGMPAEMATTRGLEGYRQNVQLFERLAALVRAQAAFGQPAMLVAAAGNESRRDLRPDFEVAVSPPAVSEGFVSVGALQKSAAGLSVARFSNTFANVSGPGVDVLSAWPGTGLRSLSGTSMATPHVAGVAVLWAEKILSSRPLNSTKWTARLIGSAATGGFQAGFDPADVGAGLVQAPQS